MSSVSNITPIYSNSSTDSDYNITTTAYYNSSTEFSINNKKASVVVSLIIGLFLFSMISLLIVLFIFGKQKFKEKVLREKLENEMVSDKIQIPKLNNSWKCVRCELRNANSYSKCNSCGFQKSESRKTTDKQLEENTNKIEETFWTKSDDSFSSLPEWKCSLCAYLNSNLRYSCDMCQQSRNILNVKPQKVAINSVDKPGKRLSLGESESVEQLRSIEEIETINRWNYIIRYCRKYNYIFVDLSFPASPKSLYLLTDKILTNSRVTQWLRPNKIKSDDKASLEWTVFDEPKPSDVCQRSIGDCWLLSAIAVLAENPKLIEKIIFPVEICSEGAYLVRLFKDGKWTTVLIDDLLPCDVYCRLVYSRAKRKQLFVSLIEKAMAKLYGCYEALNNGHSIEALSTLTGSPCETVRLQMLRYGKKHEPIDSELIWSHLLNSREDGYLMCASCGAENIEYSDRDYQCIGLNSKHCYSILDVKNVDGYRLLNLMDPWGTSEWNGDWSKSSKVWTDSTKRQLGYDNISDGMFWISFIDLIKYFGCIDICKLRPNWHEIRVEGLLPSNGKHIDVVMLTVTETTELELNLFQNVQKGKLTCNRNQMDLCVAVFNVPNNPSNINDFGLKSNSIREIRSFVWCNTILETGTYAVICLAFNHWQPITRKVNYNYPKYLLAIHSSRKLLVETLFPSDYILADTIINITLANGNKTERHDGKFVIYELAKQWFGVAVVIENRFDNQYVNVICDLSNCYNCVSTRNSFFTVDNIPPMHRQLITLLTHLNDNDYSKTQYYLIHGPHSVTMTNVLNNLNLIGITHKPSIDENVRGLHTPRPLTAINR